jgi:hypothetical protein
MYGLHSSHQAYEAGKPPACHQRKWKVFDAEARRRQARTMEQRKAVTIPTTTIQGHAICVCEMRLEQRLTGEDGREQVTYICGASGGPERGYVLARGDRGDEDIPSMVATCNACAIPVALQSPRACLNLVPVRAFPGGKRALPVIQQQAGPQELSEARTVAEAEGAYFACRWFYTWYGANQPRDIDMCLSCPHWFPRPPRELIPGCWPVTNKMLRIVRGEETIPRTSTGFAPTDYSPPSSWWRRLLHKIHF